MILAIIALLNNTHLTIDIHWNYEQKQHFSQNGRFLGQYLNMGSPEYTMSPLDIKHSPEQ